MRRKPEDDVALAIELATMCEIFHCLPSAGGLLDQDPMIMRMIREVVLAKAEKEQAEQQRRTSGV